MGSILDRVGKGKGEVALPEVECPCEGEWECYIGLWELMSKRKHGDASRETATLLFFAQDGRWGCCLNDRATGQVAFVTLPEEPSTWFEFLEDGLQSEKITWRKAKPRK
jgi:hypothetical protein